MTIIFPETRALINDIRSAIGREVNFVHKFTSDCPTCNIDPYTNTSVDPFCLTCSGTGYIITYSGELVTAHVTWNPSETMGWVAGGQLTQYSCRVQVEYTPANILAVDGSSYVEVDGKKLKVSQKTYRGVKELNRIIIDLNEI